MEQDILVQAKGIDWREIKSGELTVTEDSICMYRVPGLLKRLLGSKPKMKSEIPISAIQQVELKSDNQIYVQMADEDDKSSYESINFSSPEEAEEVTNVMGELLQRRQEEQQKEREELELQELQQESEIARKTASLIWLTVSELSNIIMGLRKTDWSVIEESWQKAINLNDTDTLNLAEHLSSFQTAIEDGSAEQLYRKVVDSFELLADFVSQDQENVNEQPERTGQFNVCPLEHHLPYFLIFTLAYIEALLCLDIGHVDESRKALERLHRLTPVLEQTFGLNTGAYIEQLTRAMESDDSNLACEACQSLKQCLDKSSMDWGEL
ncbi:MAG: hypothetical protein ACOC7P_00360 [Chloroflexota bacterium]